MHTSTYELIAALLQTLHLLVHAYFKEYLLIHVCFIDDIDIPVNFVEFIFIAFFSHWNPIESTTGEKRNNVFTKIKMTFIPRAL